MRAILIFFIQVLLFLNSFSQQNIHCLIVTDLGEIQVKLYAEHAPITVSNFLNYVDQHLYDGTTFYRVCTPENEKERKVKIEVI